MNARVPCFLSIALLALGPLALAQEPESTPTPAAAESSPAGTPAASPAATTTPESAPTATPEPAPTVADEPPVSTTPIRTLDAARPDPYAGVMRVRLSTHPVVLGIKAGPQLPSGKLGIGAGAAIEVRQPLARNGRFGAWLELGWASTSASGRTSTGVSSPVRYSVSVTELPFVAGAFQRAPLPAGLWGYAGVGLAAAETSTVSRAGAGSTTERGLALGFDVAAGAERSIGPGLLVVEGGYRRLSGGSRATGSGNLFGPGLRIGWRQPF